MRRVAVSFLTIVVVSLLAVPARAGGWWSGIGLEGAPVGIGESFGLRVSEVMFDSLEDAERAKGQTFYAYLVRSFDESALDEAMRRANPGDWWRPLTQPIRVGSVELFGWDANLVKARVRLEIPRVATGSYSLMLCDAGCDAPLGNLIPSGVDVTAEALGARATRRLEETEADLTLALRRTRADLRQTRSALRHAVAADAEQADRIEVLETRLGDTKPSPRPVPWVTYAGWFVAGSVLALLVAGRRRARPADVEALVERIPDDARELARVP